MSGENTMVVELVAANMSNTVSMSEFPAVVTPENTGKIHHDEPSSSNYHCLFSMVEGKLVVWNVGTAGGTLVNGSEVEKATVKPGDTVSIAGTSFKVNYRQPSRHYMFGPRS
jgi:pSer/pThr/pTyr-binding forkhead associated (FHA) protein